VLSAHKAWQCGVQQACISQAQDGAIAWACRWHTPSADHVQVKGLVSTTSGRATHVMLPRTEQAIDMRRLAVCTLPSGPLLQLQLCQAQERRTSGDFAGTARVTTRLQKRRRLEASPPVRQVLALVLPDAGCPADAATMSLLAQAMQGRMPKDATIASVLAFAEACRCYQAVSLLQALPEYLSAFWHTATLTEVRSGPRTTLCWHSGLRQTP
jgi:hypothetical protein